MESRRVFFVAQLVVSNIFSFSPLPGEMIQNWTNIFQMGWHHQLVTYGDSLLDILFGDAWKLRECRQVWHWHARNRHWRLWQGARGVETSGVRTHETNQTKCLAWQSLHSHRIHGNSIFTYHYLPTFIFSWFSWYMYHPHGFSGIEIHYFLIFNVHVWPKPLTNKYQKWFRIKKSSPKWPWFWFWD